MNRLLHWMAKRLKSRRIQGECAKERGPLLIRYYIANNRYFGIYLHNLLRSDIDRDLHDHPWSFISIILQGGYKEHTFSGVRTHRPGAVLFRPAKWAHSLEMNKPGWSLVFAGKTVRPWGFHTPDGWVLWRKYDAEQAERCG